MATPKKFLVSDGPSTWNLMLALFDTSPVRSRHVFFRGRVEDKPDALLLSLEIVAISKRDRSGQEWIIGGLVANKGTAGHVVNGEYSTQTRKGEF